MRPDRRDFLRMTGLAGLSLALRPGLGGLVSAARRGEGRPTLVLVELTGGNDGLNTIVPFGDDRYHRARPTLRIPAASVHAIDDVVGFAPSLQKAGALFKEGELSVVQGVGMQNPDRSHFTSLDRWHLGRTDDSARSESWLARALPGPGEEGAPFVGIAVGERVLPRVLQHPDRQALGCERLDELLPPASARAFLTSDALARLDASAGSAEDRRLAAASRRLLATLEEVLHAPAGTSAFPATESGRLLADAFRLVASGLDVPAIFVRRGGFDTHSRQAQVQPQLLADLDGGLGAFAAAAKARGLEKRVLVIVYSEFGRRVAENGSRGTDHGSGAPVLIWGGGIPGRLAGTRPDLANLDDGDVRATIDFRRILAQGLKHLGHRDPAAVLGSGIEAMM